MLKSTFYQLFFSNLFIYLLMIFTTYRLLMKKLIQLQKTTRPSVRKIKIITQTNLGWGSVLWLYSLRHICWTFDGDLKTIYGCKFVFLFIFAFICLFVFSLLFAALLTSEFSPPAVPFSKLKFREIWTFDRLQMELSIIYHLYHHLIFCIVYYHYLLFARLLVWWYHPISI